MFPMATVSHIAGAGHWVHMDKPNEFIADLKEFYRKWLFLQYNFMQFYTTEIPLLIHTPLAHLQN